jgi:hypothetical protein
MIDYKTSNIIMVVQSLGFLILLGTNNGIYGLLPAKCLSVAIYHHLIAIL